MHIPCMHGLVELVTIHPRLAFSGFQMKDVSRWRLKYLSAPWREEATNLAERVVFN